MRRKRRLKINLLIAIAMGGLTVAQAPERVTFEVATVKLSTGPQEAPNSSDPGRWTCMDCNLRTLLLQAYDVKRYQLTIPGSIDSQHYDVAGKVPAGATKEQLRLMIQNLLAERFKLTFHRAQKEMPVEFLVVAKGGPKLVEHVEEMNDAEAKAADIRVKGRGGQLDKNGFPIVPESCKHCVVGMNGKARLVSRDVTMQDFARQLTARVGKAVFDGTGLKGKYDISVTFDSAGARPTRRPGASDPTGALPLEDAIQTQLGLKLESKKGNVEMFVVDHAEKIPTEN
jgi:uncharacterized protein (TIGR03435 family)